MIRIVRVTELFIIAIDGPAASGKGTLARRLARQLGLPHLDTGLTYRAVAHALILNGDPLDDETVAVATAQKIDLTALDPAVLADHSIGNAASKLPPCRMFAVSWYGYSANLPIHRREGFWMVGTLALLYVLRPM
jgi:hypothetical protein